MDEKLITVDELAEKLKVDKSWIYRRTRERGPGTLPRLKVGKLYRFNFRNVMAWLEQGQQ